MKEVEATVIFKFLVEDELDLKKGYVVLPDRFREFPMITNIFMDSPVGEYIEHYTLSTREVKDEL